MPSTSRKLVAWLIEAGVIITDGDQWRVIEDRVETARVPPTLKGVLQARLDCAVPLPSTWRCSVPQSSVSIFWDDAVDDLGSAPGVATGRDVHAAETLEQLRSRAVVFERERSAFDGTREFLFKHALLRDATYESVLRSHRQVYHGLAARWLERATSAAAAPTSTPASSPTITPVPVTVPAPRSWYLRAAGRPAPSTR